MAQFSHKPQHRLAMLLAAAGMSAMAHGAHAAEPPPVDPKQLAGNTLSAVVHVVRPPGAAGGGLQRIVLQAYLSPDGGTLVRQWVPERNSYSAPAQTHWSLSSNRLCIDLPPIAANGSPARPLCADVHVWWPRIAGMAGQPYAMLNGDLQRGNAIGGRRVR